METEQISANSELEGDRMIEDRQFNIEIDKELPANEGKDSMQGATKKSQEEKKKKQIIG